LHILGGAGRGTNFNDNKKHVLHRIQTRVLQKRFKMLLPYRLSKLVEIVCVSEGSLQNYPKVP
jgi:hypothetical protein